MNNRNMKHPTSLACRWLAGFYLDVPDMTELQSYCSDDGQAFLTTIAGVPALEEVVALLQTLVAPDADLTSTQAQLASAFTRNFSVGGPRSVPPYASVYLSENGLLYQQPTRDMNILLTDLDMHLPDTIREPADHLGVQLHVLAELIDRKLKNEALSLNPSAFAEQHMLNWLPDFMRRSDMNLGSEFYSVLGRAVFDLVLATSDIKSQWALAG